MAELTKEWLLRTIAELEEERDATPGAVNEDDSNTLAAMRIALASLEAEAVAWRWNYGGSTNFRFQYSEPRAGDNPKCQRVIQPLFTAPPAPVSVPDALPENDDEEGNDIDYMEPSEIYALGRTAGWNAYRAAMLQSFGNSEQPNHPESPDGWVMVPVEPTAEMISSGIAAHFERSQTQIHDRPAPGTMECAYVAMLAAAPQQEVK